MLPIASIAANRVDVSCAKTYCSDDSVMGYHTSQPAALYHEVERNASFSLVRVVVLWGT